MPLLIVQHLLADAVILDLGRELAVTEALQATADGLGLRLAQAGDGRDPGSHGSFLEQWTVMGHFDFE